MELTVMRGAKDMKNKQNIKLRKSPEDRSDSRKAESFANKWLRPVLLNLLPSALVWIATFVVFFIKLPIEMNAIREDLSGISEDIRELRNENNLLERELNQKIEDLYGKLLSMSGVFTYTPTAEAEKLITYAYQNPDRDFEHNGIKATTLVAYDKTTGVEYTAAELANKRLLLPYRNGSQEVFFYGQFNENGQWEGPCVINVYTDGKLEIITEATYDNGIVLSSKQAFFYTAEHSGQDVWAIAERVREIGVDGNMSDSFYGDTRLYIKEDDYTQMFAFDEVSEEDIIEVDGFEEIIDSRLYATYHGNTSDGYFNDDTGSAYMVYFFEDGTVRMLYVGNFKDGTFNDSTGNAWHIAKAENTTYMYYKGNFKDGWENHNADYDFENYLTIERINEIMSENCFTPHIELKWSSSAVET